MPNLPFAWRGRDDDHTINLNQMVDIPITLYTNDDPVVILHLDTLSLDFLIKNLPDGDGFTRDLTIAQRAVGQCLVSKGIPRWRD